MKKSILILFSLLFGIILGYSIFFLVYYSTFDEKLKKKIIPKEKYEIILKYLNIVNHIRPDYVSSPELVYSIINHYTNGTNILMQGDSWFEQINFPAKDNAESYFDVNIINPIQNDLKSFNFILNWAKHRNIGIINSGTGSYSPSLMSIQLEILEKDFNIYPEVLITYIDQTDIGDEICRYSQNKVYQNGSLIRVGSTKSLSKSIFNYTRILELSKIDLSFDSKFLKVFNSVNYEINWEIKKFIYINYIRFLNIFKKNKIKKCSISEILSYLSNSSDQEITYFKYSVDEYLKRVLSKEHIKQVYLVTFPHLYQLKNIYEKKQTELINVSNLIDDVIKEGEGSFKNVHHINFSKIVSENQEMFQYDDYLFDNMHLKQKPHELFISEIFKILDYTYLKN